MSIPRDKVERVVKTIVPEEYKGMARVLRANAEQIGSGLELVGFGKR